MVREVSHGFRGHRNRRPTGAVYNAAPDCCWPVASNAGRRTWEGSPEHIGHSRSLSLSSSCAFSTELCRQSRRRRRRCRKEEVATSPLRQLNLAGESEAAADEEEEEDWRRMRRKFFALANQRQSGRPSGRPKWRSLGRRTWRSWPKLATRATAAAAAAANLDESPSKLNWRFLCRCHQLRRWRLKRA